MGNPLHSGYNQSGVTYHCHSLRDQAGRSQTRSSAMSTFLQDADLVEVKFAMYSTDLTQVALNIRHYRITGITGAVSDTDMAQIMDSNFSPIYGAVIPAAASWYGVQAQIITTLP